MLEDNRNDGRNENSVEALQFEKLRVGRAGFWLTRMNTVSIPCKSV